MRWVTSSEWTSGVTVTLSLAATLLLLAIQQPEARPSSAHDGRRIWLETLAATWFLERWAPGGDLATQVARGGAREGRLGALDHYFRSRRPVRGLPRGFMSHRGSLDRFRERREIGIRSYPASPWKAPFDWNRDTADRDATYFAELHSWRYLPELLAAYRENGDPGLLAAVEEVVEDWVRQNPYPEGAHPRAWHEGAVMKRILVLIDWVNTLIERPAPETERLRPYQVAALLVQHVEHLLRPGVYTGIGNHGVRQDLALILASFALPEARLGRPPRTLSAEDWQEMALERLVGQQIGVGFTREGIWREHSPAYHWYVIGLLEEVRQALVANEASVPLELSGVLAGSERYLTHVLTPKGRFPPVGDSEERSLSARVATTEALRFSASGGQEGTPPSEIDGVFPEAGEAILRDRWGRSPADHARRFYLHLHAAQHLPMGHRHQDDLSFIVHHDGRWWVVEGGKYGYRKDAVRRHVVSPYAHNGPILEGGIVGPDDRPDLSAWVDPLSSHTPNVAAVRAGTERFARPSGSPGARAERILVLLRDRPAVVVVDRLVASPGGMWESLLHLAPGLTVRRSDELRFEATTPDSELILDLLSSNGTFGTAAVLLSGTGSERSGSDRRTWTSPGRGEVVSTATLSIRRRGDRLIAPMLLTWRQADDAPVEGLWIEEGENGVVSVGWSEGEERVRLELAFDGEPLREVEVERGRS